MVVIIDKAFLTESPDGVRRRQSDEDGAREMNQLFRYRKLKPRRTTSSQMPERPTGQKYEEGER